MMIRKSSNRWILCFFIFILLQTHTMATDRQVAITIDDLPRGGDSRERSLDAVRDMTVKLLAPFKEQGIPVAGFVNEGRNVDFGPEGLREILGLWLDAGADLGNHTYSHPDINNVSLVEYTADITKGEPALKELLAGRGRELKYFRHPFLRAGPTPEKKTGMQRFLEKHGYTVVPVTIDNADYLYAALYTRPQYRDRIHEEYLSYMESVVAFFEERSVEVVGREFPQILLIHANQLNADMMPELLAMFRRRGYSFLSVAEALTDDIYHLAEDYVGPGGFSWIHRWSMTKGMKARAEPEPPDWAWAAFSNR